MAKKTWGGRFREETDALLDRFNASLPFDKRLYAQDIRGSLAHCRMLAHQGIITQEEASEILSALSQIKEEMDRGEFDFNQGHEDIHTLVEKALIERIGPVGEKLHTGRSRNDQVSLDVRLYVRDAIEEVIKRLEETVNKFQKLLILEIHREHR